MRVGNLLADQANAGKKGYAAEYLSGCDGFELRRKMAWQSSKSGANCTCSRTLLRYPRLVASFTDKHTFLAAVVVYGVSALYSIFLFRKGFRRHDYMNYGLLAAAFALHTVAMFQRGFSLSRCPIHNLYEATVFIMWTMVVACLALGLWPRLRFLGAFAAPILFIIGVFALMPGLDAPGAGMEASRAWLSFHVAMFALAYGAFGLSSAAALMYLTQERDLKLHKFRAILAKLPPIQRLEVVASRLLVAGFVMLTLALIVSFAGLRQGSVGNWLLDAKILWSVFVWAIYLVLVIMRWTFAQGGRRFAWGAIATFVFVVLTFPLFSLLSPIHKPAATEREGRHASRGERSPYEKAPSSKLQIPNSNKVFPVPILPPKLRQAGYLSCFWSLPIGSVLMFGSWSLELGASTL